MCNYQAYCNFFGLLEAISLALLFVLFMTGVYKKSYSTAVTVIASALALHVYIVGEPLWSMIILTVTNIALIFRSMFHHENDKLLRG